MPWGQPVAGGQKPPGAEQKRYHGLIRNDMRSAMRHLHYLDRWDSWYLFVGSHEPYYPSQLYISQYRAQIQQAISSLEFMLGQTGPIPPAPGSIIGAREIVPAVIPRVYPWNREPVAVVGP